MIGDSRRKKENEINHLPNKVPKKKADTGTSNIGEARFMSQLGKTGVIRKKIIK